MISSVYNTASSLSVCLFSLSFVFQRPRQYARLINFAIIPIFSSFYRHVVGNRCLSPNPPITFGPYCVLFFFVSALILSSLIGMKSCQLDSRMDVSFETCLLGILQRLSQYPLLLKVAATRPVALLCWFISPFMMSMGVPHSLRSLVDRHNAIGHYRNWCSHIHQSCARIFIEP